jgi:hypothetical protein
LQQITYNGQGGGKPTIIGQRGLENKNEIIIIMWLHYLVLGAKQKKMSLKANLS